MTANIGTLQAGWEESRVEEHLTESLVQGKVAVSFPFLSTSSLPKMEGLVAGAPSRHSKEDNKVTAAKGTHQRLVSKLF